LFKTLIDYSEKHCIQQVFQSPLLFIQHGTKRYPTMLLFSIRGNRKKPEDLIPWAKVFKRNPTFPGSITMWFNTIFFIPPKEFDCTGQERTIRPVTFSCSGEEIKR